MSESGGFARLLGWVSGWEWGGDIGRRRAMTVFPAPSLKSPPLSVYEWLQVRPVSVATSLSLSYMYVWFGGILFQSQPPDLEFYRLTFLGGSDGKDSACHVRDPGSIPGLGRSPGEGNGNPLQYSCLENPMNRTAWWATVHGVRESDTVEGTEHAGFDFFLPSLVWLKRLYVDFSCICFILFFNG